MIPEQHPGQVCGSYTQKGISRSISVLLLNTVRVSFLYISTLPLPVPSQVGSRMPFTWQPLLWSDYGTQRVSLPLKQEEVDIIVALCEEVSKHSCWVATTDLVGRQPKVNTFHKVPKLSNQVLAEFPKTEIFRKVRAWTPLLVKGYQFRILTKA